MALGCVRVDLTTRLARGVEIFSLRPPEIPGVALDASVRAIERIRISQLNPESE